MRLRLEIILVLATLFILGCGGASTTSSDSTNKNPDENTSGLETNLKLSVNLSLQLHKDGETFPEFVFPDSRVLSLNLASNGLVSFQANAMEPIILRVCPASISSLSCDVFSEAEGIGAGLDLVIDLCGSALSHAECGEDDPTLFDGYVREDGAMLLNDVGIRLRVFLLGTSGPEGAAAKSTDRGFIPDLPRLTLDFKTSPAVDTGVLSAEGKAIANRRVTLVGGGILPDLEISDDLPNLGGAEYTATLDGTFDLDPLALLE